MFNYIIEKNLIKQKGNHINYISNMAIAEGGWAYRAKRRYEGSKRALYAYPPSADLQHSNHFFIHSIYSFNILSIRYE